MLFDLQIISNYWENLPIIKKLATKKVAILVKLILIKQKCQNRMKSIKNKRFFRRHSPNLALWMRDCCATCCHLRRQPLISPPVKIPIEKRKYQIKPIRLIYVFNNFVVSFKNTFRHYFHFLFAKFYWFTIFYENLRNATNANVLIPNDELKISYF